MISIAKTIFWAILSGILSKRNSNDYNEVPTVPNVTDRN